MSLSVYCKGRSILLLFMVVEAVLGTAELRKGAPSYGVAMAV